MLSPLHSSFFNFFFVDITNAREFNLAEQESLISGILRSQKHDVKRYTFKFDDDIKLIHKVYSEGVIAVKKYICKNCKQKFFVVFTPTNVGLIVSKYHGLEDCNQIVMKNALE